MSAEEIPDDDSSLQLLEAAEQHAKALARIRYAEVYAAYLVGIISEEAYEARTAVLAYELNPDDCLRVESEVEEAIFADIALRALHFASFNRLGNEMRRRYEAEELREKYFGEEAT